MKCTITGNETKNKAYGNFPLSKEGRKILSEVVEAHNQRIKEAFIEAHSEKGLTEEHIASLSPKVSPKYTLSLINREENDVMETLKSVMTNQEE